MSVVLLAESPMGRSGDGRYLLCLLLLLLIVHATIRRLIAGASIVSHKRLVALVFHEDRRFLGGRVFLLQYVVNQLDPFLDLLYAHNDWIRMLLSHLVGPNGFLSTAARMCKECIVRGIELAHVEGVLY